MFGTVVNALAILFGGGIGVCLKNFFTEKYRVVMIQAVGMSVLFVGLSGALSKMILPEAHPMLFIVSMVIGGIVGTWLDIEGRLKALGDFLEKRFANSEISPSGKSASPPDFLPVPSKSNISDGFVKASLLFCIGTMAILGAVQSGVENKHSILLAKSALDGVTSIIFASTMGLGVLLSGGSVFLYQGGLTLLARVIAPFLTEDMLREISIVGGILITILGLDMLEIKKIKAGNLLPAVLVPVVYYLILGQ